MQQQEPSKTAIEGHETRKEKLAQKEETKSSDPPLEEEINESQADGEPGIDDGEQNILQKIQYACCGIGA